MKGPGLRNDLEIRRTFRCPQCGRTVLKLGDVVSMTCSCAEPPVWMLIQPDVKKREFKFDKIEIPLTEADLLVRERPRRLPEPPPEGTVENPNDRRNVRPKRPKPERRSFESFQEDLAAKVGAASGEIVEVTVTGIAEPVSLTPDIATPPATADDKHSDVPANDEFGEGL